MIPKHSWILKIRISVDLVLIVEEWYTWFIIFHFNWRRKVVSWFGIYWCKWFIIAFVIDWECSNTQIASTFLAIFNPWNWISIKSWSNFSPVNVGWYWPVGFRDEHLCHRWWIAWGRSLSRVIKSLLFLYFTHQCTIFFVTLRKVTVQTITFWWSWWN